MLRSENGACTRRGLAAAHWWAIAIGIAVAMASSAGAQSPAAIRRDTLRASLGAGYVTKAEFTAPASAQGLVPAVLLIHGATPADLDFTVARTPGDMGSSNSRTPPSRDQALPQHVELPASGRGLLQPSALRLPGLHEG